MDPILLDAAKTLGLPMAIAAYILWKGSGEKPLWVFGNYFRQVIADRDAHHTEEMARRDAELVRRDQEYEAALMRRDVELAHERNARIEWQGKYVTIMETAHAAISQTVRVIEATAGTTAATALDREEA